MRRYPMTLSTGAKLLSAAVSVLVLAVPFLVWGVIPGVRVGPGSELSRWLVLLAPLLILAAWALSPAAVELEGSEFRVRRRAWRAASWRLGEVESVAALPPRWLRGATRTFGSGGLFGFYGLYAKGGIYRLLATRTDTLVEVAVAGKRVVVSPDDPARFVEGLLAVAPRARRAQAAGVEAGAARASRRS